MLRVFLVSAVVVVTSHAYAPLQSPAPAAPSIVGEWTLNKDLSDTPGDQFGRGRDDGDRGRRGGGLGRGGFGRRGGFGGGRGAGDSRSAEEIQRLRDAVPDELQAPDRMTITQSGTTVVITTDDG